MKATLTSLGVGLRLKFGEDGARPNSRAAPPCVSFARFDRGESEGR